MRVLFVGNSHTYFNDMPQTFADLCEALTGDRPQVTMLAFSGRALAWHCEEYFSLRFALLYGGYDYCVIQQRAHSFPGEESLAEGAERIGALCAAGGTKLALFMTWAQKEHPENLAEMSRAYRAVSRKCGAILLPVGEVFAAVRAAHPEIELYWKDGAHASPYGSFAIAATAAYRLTGRNDRPLPAGAGRDFGVVFDTPDKKPLALEDKARVRCPLDPARAEAVCEIVRKVLAG